MQYISYKWSKITLRNIYNTFRSETFLNMTDPDGPGLLGREYRHAPSPRNL